MKSRTDAKKSCLLCVLGLGLLVGQGLQARAQQPQSAAREDSLTKATEYYYQAVLARSADQPHSAYQLLRHAHALAPEDGDIAYLLGRVAADLGREAESLPLLELAYRVDSSRREYGQALASAYFSRERLQDALRITEQLAKADPDNDDMRYRLVQLYARSGDLKKAIELCGELQERFKRNVDAYGQVTQMKIQLQRMAGEGSHIFDEHYRRLELFPDDRAANYDYGLYLINRRLDSSFDKFLKDKQRQGYLKPVDAVVLRVHQALDRKKYADAERLLASVNQDTTLPTEEKLQLWALVSSSQQEAESALLQDQYLPYVEQLVKLDPKAALQYYVRLLRYKERYREAIALLEPASKQRADEPWLWDEYFQDAVGLEDEALIGRVASEALRHVPTDWRYHITAASELYTAGKREEARLALERACQEVEPKTGIGPGRILGLLADLYASGTKEERAKANEYYEAALAAYDSDPEVLNNYAYRLAKAGQELDKAERLAGQAVKLSPKAPHILDTYAYIYLRLKNYTLAKLYQRKALDEAGESASADMYEHMGDILAAEADWAEAERYWTLAEAAYQKKLAEPDLEPSQAEELCASLPTLKKKINYAKKKIQRP